jgi:sodium-coupled neutral amino acid transporter 7/8
LLRVGTGGNSIGLDGEQHMSDGSLGGGSTGQRASERASSERSSSGGGGGGGFQRTGTRTSMGLNLILSAAGAGVLSFPFAFRAMGLALGAAATLLFGAFNVLTLTILVHFTLRLDAAGQLRARTYEELCLRLLGERAYLAAVWCIVLGTCGALCGFLIIIGDVGVPVLQSLLGEGAFVASRGGIVVLFATFVVFPLSLLGTFSELACSSAVSVAAVVVVAAAVVAKGWSGPALAEGFDGGGAGGGPGGVDCGDACGVQLWAQPSWSILIGFPIAIFSLGCHLQVVPLVTEVREPRHRCVSTLGAVCAASSGLCVALYVATGAFGYLAFGGSVAQDVLTNFPDSEESANWDADAAKGLMVLHIVLAAPVVLYPGARCVAFFARRRGLDRRLARAVACCLGGGNCCCPGLLALSQSAAAGRAAASGPILLLCALMAVYVPQVAVLFALVGATVSTAEIFLFPAAMIFTHLRWGGARVAGVDASEAVGGGSGRGDDSAALRRASSMSFGRPLLVEDYNTPVSEVINPLGHAPGLWDTRLVAVIESRGTAVLLLCMGCAIGVLGTGTTVVELFS